MLARAQQKMNTANADIYIGSIIWGMALRRPGHVDQESASVGAPSGAGRTAPVRLKPHLPRIFEIIQVSFIELIAGCHEGS